MLWTIFFGGVLNIVGWLFNLLHLFPVTQIPFVDGYLVTGWGYVIFLETAIPPVGIAAAGFIFILTFKFILMLIRGIPFIGRMFSK